MQPAPTDHDDLQALCESASDALRVMDYVQTERLLERAEALALARLDFDTLARLYFPLQEARRQKRQRAGEGPVQLSIAVTSAEEELNVQDLYARLPHGLFLVAGLATTAPAESLRKLYRAGGNYAEVALGAALPIAGGGMAIFALPRPADLSDVPRGISPDEWRRALPPHAVFVGLSTGKAELMEFGNTYAGAMALFEQLHRPFLAQADALPTSVAKLEAYRAVAGIDPACELAHQRAAQTARELARAGG